ncbi:MAG TPA: hypothetical protein VN706_24035 [Gemmatimonadaceae bacterium]|nr:hypothetical protein [Gemmatimonadaceae bacterium]
MRKLVRDGVPWEIREVDSSRIPGARRDRCLIYECEGIVRRVWNFSDTWAELSDDALWSLLDGPAAQPAPQQPSDTNVTHVAQLGDDARVVAERTRSLLQEVALLRETNSSLRGEREDIVDRCRGLREHMHQAIAHYAESLRADGIPPERALILMKSALQLGLAGCDDREPDAEQLLHEGVDWGIDAYYAA